MKLTAPKLITFIVGVVLGILALVFQYVGALNLEGWAFWTAIVAIVVLVLGNVVKGL